MHIIEDTLRDNVCVNLFTKLLRWLFHIFETASVGCFIVFSFFEGSVANVWDSSVSYCSTFF